MTELRSYKIRKFAKPHQSSSISPAIPQEVPLLAAIAQELCLVGDDVPGLLSAARQLLRDAFQSIDHSRGNEHLDTA